MGHGNSTKVDTTGDYKAALAEEKKKTPGQQMLEDATAKSLGWYAKGDFRDPHAGGPFVNYADQGMLNRNRDLMMNAGRQGISALGTPDPNQLAAVQENVKAHQAEDAAAQYEKDLQEGFANASAAAGNAEGFDINRKSAALGVTSDLFKQHEARPRWWQALLSAGAQVGTGFATGGLSTMLKH